MSRHLQRTIILSAQFKLTKQGPPRALRTNSAFSLPDDGVLDALLSVLAGEPKPLDELVRLAVALDTSASNHSVRFWLAWMDHLGIAEQALIADAKVLARRSRIALLPNSSQPLPFDRSRRYRVAPSVYVRPNSRGGIDIRSPDSEFAVAVEDRALTDEVVAQLLGDPDRKGDFKGADKEAFASLLHDARLLIADDHEPDTSRELYFADAVFHAASRYGTAIEGYGRSAGDLERLPEARWEDDVVATIELQSLNLTAAAEQFRDLLLRRKSNRSHGAPPISVAQLGNLLGLTFGAANEGKAPLPHASGGGLYLIRPYVIVQHVSGIESGLYAYDAATHTLGNVRPFDRGCERTVLAYAPMLRTNAETVQAIVLLATSPEAARHYLAIGYSNILKEVGEIYQLLYLSCASLNLAGCAIGGGSATSELLFEDRHRLVVGEFSVGSLSAAG